MSLMMNSCQPAEDNYVVFYFGLIVTGEGEELSLPHLFKSIHVYSETHPFACHFEVIRRIGQRSPKKDGQKNNQQKMVGTNKSIPSKDAQDISFPARNYLHSKPCSHVILIDDLEYDRKDIALAIFERYRIALDLLLEPDEKKGLLCIFW